MTANNHHEAQEKKLGLDADNGPIGDSFIASHTFYDDDNFPHGLHRSGDFTRRQADVLTEHGVTL